MAAKQGFRNILGSAATAQRRLGRQRGNSLSTIPPAETDTDYIPELATHAASILYRSPLPSQEGRPIYILNAAAFPDAFEVDYDSLLSYVLNRLPKEDELLSGQEYEIVFFAGGQPEGATTEKKNGPGIGWYIQAYHVLNRALRKRLQKLYIVHPRTWVRVLLGVFGTIVSPKFRRKLIHVNTLSALALQIPVENLLIPPSVYLQDRKVSPDIYVPYATGRRAFGARHPLPKNLNTGDTRLPRVLRETTAFLLTGDNVKTEGLFRIPPNSVLSGVLKEAYDRGQRWIIWKERGATLAEPGLDPQLLESVKLEDAYAVHQAAALIKVWYRELREPVFPESSYSSLREKYGAKDAQVTPEDLVDIILPQSETSPLRKNSRAILTRHLLPLLSEVAQHEPRNKMTAENLAIVFSMCLLCGSNQLEDAKMSETVRKILIAAIEMWPQLMEGMGIARDDFWKDLEPPADPNDYEDPLDEQRPPRQRLSEDDAVEGREGHRIVLEDSEIGTVSEKQAPPKLPPRPSRPTSASGSPTDGASHPPAVPKRKPAPHHPVEPAPPRYSTVFGADGESLHVDSPASYNTPANGFGPPRRGNWSLDEDMKKGFLPTEIPQPSDPHPALGVPKRKAVSGEHKTADSADHSLAVSPAEPARSASEGQPMAALAAQAAALNLGHTTVAPPPAEVVQSPEDIIDPSPATTATFRKPSWPASARPQTLAKPVLPPRQSQTVPIIKQPNEDTAPTVPRVRAPSPGLLKRMSSMETSTAPSSTPATSMGSDGTSERSPRLQPNKLNLKKQSVEDLRRLYEERNSMAAGLAKADEKRRKSTASSLSSY